MTRLKKPLTESLKESIRRDCILSPMRLDYYMAICLAHPDDGYYQNHDMFGKAGDFTTAPEISQLFGEIIAAWLIWNWQEKGAPDCVLAEAGAGRGSLMLDILTHAQKICPEFMTRAEIHLIETSPHLRKIQKNRLKNYMPIWHDRIEQLPDKFVILLGNEFLDALPIRQFYRQDNLWLETHITADNTESVLRFCKIKAELPLPIAELQLQKGLAQNGLAVDGKWLEFSQAAIDFCDNLSIHIGKFGGFGLLMDYGDTTALRDSPSFQALSKHLHANPLENPGKADLTAHVNFSLLDYIFRNHHLDTAFYMQSHFLSQFGIEARAKKLSAENPKHQKAIEQALNRLVNHDEMGELFKFMAIGTC